MGNLVGLIDSDYQGELKVPLWNRSTEDFLVSSGDRIAQMILVPIKQAKLRVVQDFSETDRGEIKDLVVRELSKSLFIFFAFAI